MDVFAVAALTWSPDNVEHVRRTYVDQARVVVAIGERIRIKV